MNLADFLLGLTVLWGAAWSAFCLVAATRRRTNRRTHRLGRWLVYHAQTISPGRCRRQRHNEDSGAAPGRKSFAFTPRFGRMSERRKPGLD